MRAFCRILCRSRTIACNAGRTEHAPAPAAGVFICLPMEHLRARYSETIFRSVDECIPIDYHLNHGDRYQSADNELL